MEKENNNKDTIPQQNQTEVTSAESQQSKPKGGEEESVLNAIRELTAYEDTPRQSSHSKMTLASILGGDILGGKWFRKQFWYIVMVVAMVIVYVSNRYSCQQEMIQTKLLTDTLLDCRYKALTRSSQLKEKMRRSVIENSLADTTLQTANSPLYRMKVDEE